MSVIRSIFCAAGGALLFWALPLSGVAAATQELIAFLALLMAGLLPAMILTATILRAGGLSSKRIEQYGAALKLQLRFWAVLFCYAGLSSAAVTLVKIFSALPEGERPTLMLAACVLCAGGSLGLVIQRLWPAYQGLVSLLELNVGIAKTEAIVNDRTRLDALQADAAVAATAQPYENTIRAQKS